MTNVGYFFLLPHAREGSLSVLCYPYGTGGEKRLKYSGSHHNLILIPLAMDSPQHHAGDV